jgi:hypothetical protein
VVSVALTFARLPLMRGALRRSGLCRLARRRSDPRRRFGAKRGCPDLILRLRARCLGAGSRRGCASRLRRARGLRVRDWRLGLLRMRGFARSRLCRCRSLRILVLRHRRWRRRSRSSGGSGRFDVRGG